MSEVPESSDPVALKRWLRFEARALGFTLFGIAPTHDWPSADRLAPWLAAGHHGEMAWLERSPDVRTNVRARFEWARSVAMVGMVYRTDEPCAPAPERPISRYAWGDDYHDLLRGRLRELGERLGRHAGPGRRWFEVDTGPLLERAAAASAGLGWLGKNTLLLSQEEGSFLFLGALILDLPLPPDPAAPGRCGRCTRCLEVCPTRAFVAPYLLDARRCISYLTIELRGPIPTELREGVGQMVFGCDLCQAVCPWNERAATRQPPSVEPAFRARPGLTGPTLPLLLELLTQDDETFRARFRRSPVKRAKRRGLARNAAVALGNRGDPQAVEALARAAADDPEPLVRAHACWALGRLLPAARGTRHAQTAREALARAASYDEAPSVREEARLALKETGAEPGATQETT